MTHLSPNLTLELGFGLDKLGGIGDESFYRAGDHTSRKRLELCWFSLHCDCVDLKVGYVVDMVKYPDWRTCSLHISLVSSHRSEQGKGSSLPPPRACPTRLAAPSRRRPIFRSGLRAGYQSPCPRSEGFFRCMRLSTR
jgi:hypothetical protein